VAINDRGFPVVVLYGPDSKTRYLRQLNNLVADAFLPPKPVFEDRGFQETAAVWHIDGDLTNCRADNLRWEPRSRVLEWNDMHRYGESRFVPVNARVKNNRTGAIYENTYECAIAEGVPESDIIWAIEKQARHIQDDKSHYRYLFSDDS
jgi:hypothetical protein